jgi:FtsH-binding integral membrane protein
MEKVHVPKVLFAFDYIARRTRLVFSLLLVCLTISLIISIFMHDLTWLSAFGGVATIFGILLTVSHSVPKTEKEINRFIDTLYPENRDGIMPELQTKEQKEEDSRRKLSEANRILKSEALGLLITITGTLIWAYAPFLNPFLFTQHA